MLWMITNGDFLILSFHLHLLFSLTFEGSEVRLDEDWIWAIEFRNQVILYLFQSQVSAGSAIEIAKEVDQRENRSLPMKG